VVHRALDSFTDTVFASTRPYSSRRARDVRNAQDNIFSGGGAQSTLVVTKSGGGYASTINMGVKSA
jgi:hypothetical protein